jgi:hypothetical protein
MFMMAAPSNVNSAVFLEDVDEAHSAADLDVAVVRDVHDGGAIERELGGILGRVGDERGVFVTIAVTNVEVHVHREEAKELYDA